MICWRPTSYFIIISQTLWRLIVIVAIRERRLRSVKAFSSPRRYVKTHVIRPLELQFIYDGGDWKGRKKKGAKGQLKVSVNG